MHVCMHMCARVNVKVVVFIHFNFGNRGLIEMVVYVMVLVLLFVVVAVVLRLTVVVMSDDKSGSIIH